MRPTTYKNSVRDDENQLLSVATDTSGTPAGSRWKSDFTHDGRGRLRKRADSTWYTGGSGGWYPSGETRYIYDGMRVIQERNSGSTPTVSYTRGNDLSGSPEGAGGIGGLLARSHGYSAGTWTLHNFYHADGNGNITALANASQALVAQYRYDPYGNTITSSGTLAAANTMRFSSKQAQDVPGLNLYYYGYRFYEPSVQRWLNRDPIGEKGGINLYGFVRNAPAHLIDLFGLTMCFPPGTPSAFEDHWIQCMCELSKSPLGRKLPDDANRPWVDLPIRAVPGARGMAGGKFIGGGI